MKQINHNDFRITCEVKSALSREALAKWGDTSEVEEVMRKSNNNVIIMQLMRHLRWFVIPARRESRLSLRAKRGNLNNTGAALVITLIIVTVVSAIIFSVNRMLVSEVKQITKLEDSEMAYQAAESGIEAGLLLYRYNNNVEVPSDVVGGMDESIDKVMRVNVTDGSLESKSIDLDVNNLTNLKRNQQYYDLKIWHKNANENGVSQEEVKSEPCNKVTNNDSTQSYPNYCVADNPGESSSTASIPALSKDGSVEYNINNLDGNIYLKWGYKNLGHYPTQAEQSQMRLEYTAFDENDDIVGKDLFIYRDSEISSILGNGKEIEVSGSKLLRIKSWGGNLENYKLTLASTGEKLDSRYTYIESTGYYGGSKRKLKVKIDRQTGSIISAYDFVILSPGSITGQ